MKNTHAIEKLATRHFNTKHSPYSTNEKKWKPW